jgi:hypothetical protein
MSYTALGIVYDIPTKSSSSFIPDSTLTMDVPVPQMTSDFVAWAWPDLVGRTQQFLPSLVDQAWPYVMAKMPDAVSSVAPAAVDAAWPTLEPKLVSSVNAMAPKVFNSLLPSIRQEIRDAIATEERKAVVVGTLMALGIATLGYYGYKHLAKR